MANDDWRAAEARRDAALAFTGFFGRAAAWLGGAGLVLGLIIVPASLQPYGQGTGWAAWLWVPVVALVLAGASFLLSLIPAGPHVEIPESERRRRAEQAREWEIQLAEARESVRRAEVARRAEWERTPEGRMALAKSTDTPKERLRSLAQLDPLPEVRRAAIETLALLNQAGL